MKFSLAIAAFAASALAHPSIEVAKRGPGLPATAAVNDYDIINYALTLEHLEDMFYKKGLATFSYNDFCNAGFSPAFYKNLKEIAYDESTHVMYLNKALISLGQKPVAACKYDFPFTSPSGFVMLASVLEGVGVSAYLGAAARIATRAYITAAGSILTVEARHNAYIRAALAESPFPAPFDTPLDFNPVYSLAAQFITSCPPENPKLPFTAFPPLALVPQSTYAGGGDLEFLVKKGLSHTRRVYAVFFIPGGPIYVHAKYIGKDTYKTTIPAAASGQTYVVLQYGNTKVDDSTILVGPAVFEATAIYH